jgi:hypothetical protein
MQACENVLTFLLRIERQENGCHVFGDGKIPAPFFPF